jgi:uncharacterized membrane protein YagU involved in acid resistance
MEKRRASKLAKYYRVPITWIYEDTEYWSNTFGHFFVSLEILKEDILKSFKFNNK